MVCWIYRCWTNRHRVMTVYECVYECGFVHMGLVPLEGSRIGWDPIALELQAVTSCLWVLGIEVWLSARAAHALNCGAISPAPEGTDLNTRHSKIRVTVASVSSSQVHSSAGNKDTRVFRIHRLGFPHMTSTGTRLVLPGLFFTPLLNKDKTPKI